MNFQSPASSHPQVCHFSCKPVIDAKFLLLHEGRNEDGIKSFFNEIYELFVKVRQIFTLNLI